LGGNVFPNITRKNHSSRSKKMMPWPVYHERPGGRLA
jgi:hypothetical protein